MTTVKISGAYADGQEYERVIEVATAPRLGRIEEWWDLFVCPYTGDNNPSVDGCHEAEIVASDDDQALVGLKKEWSG